MYVYQKMTKIVIWKLSCLQYLSKIVVLFTFVDLPDKRTYSGENISEFENYWKMSEKLFEKC